MNRFRLILAYLKYLSGSKTKYRVHSPFVYDLIVNVFEDRTFYPEYKEVEMHKEQLQHDPRRIARTDMGARKAKEDIRTIIADIAANECIRERYGRLLFRIVKKFKPGNILELGTSLGISSSYMAAASGDSKIYTIEGCHEISVIAEETFSQMNYTNIEIIQGNFDQVLPGVLNKLKNVDMIFIDGNHCRYAVLNYFNQILPKVHNDTILIFDDINWSDEMSDAWATICANETVKVTIDIFQLGIVFFKKELSKEDFIIRYC